MNVVRMDARPASGSERAGLAAAASPARRASRLAH
jgi:hypothetical protein